VAPVRGSWPVIAACAAGLILAPAAPGAAALAATGSAGATGAASGGSGLPGPGPDCPAQAGIAAPAGLPWAQQVLDFADVWDLTRGAGVTVAVVDSGVDANPQFGDRVTLGPDLAGDDTDDPDPDGDADCVGHGTSVAGIIAAAPVAGVSFTGVAPAARILSIKISDTDEFPDSVAPAAIRDAVELGASVINLSLATTADSPALRSAVDFALGSNVVVVAAAGNDDQQSGVGPFYPAAYPGVLSVGAVGPDGSRASFSDTHTPASVTAPGMNVTSTYPGTFPDSYDPADNGTSFSTAFVSGVVALVRSYYPQLDEAQVVARIEATADGAAGPGTGHGLVNPVQAVTAVLPATGLSGAGSSGSGTPAGAGKPAGHTVHIAITRAVPPDKYARSVALTVTASSFGLMILILAVAIVIRPGIKRPNTNKTPARLCLSRPSQPHRRRIVVVGSATILHRCGYRSPRTGAVASPGRERRDGWGVWGWRWVTGRLG
jgi:membrane-anchored mycosin MYCP